jgi:hypothetical protein
MQLVRPIDYIYLLLCSAAGVWQWWCAVYGQDNIITVVLALLMSLPFTLASYWHARRISTASDWPDWKRMLVLWAGMPLSLVVGSMTGFAETKVLLSAGFRMENLPFYFFRIAVAEAAACGAWTICLVVWFRQPGLHLSRRRILALFASLFGGVLSAQALSYLINTNFHQDIYLLSTSVIATAISGMSLVFLRIKHSESQGALPG